MDDLAGLGYVDLRPLGGGRYAEAFAARGPSGEVALKIARPVPLESEELTDAMFLAEGAAFHTGSVGVHHPDPRDVLAAEASVLRRIRHPAFPAVLAEGEALIGGVARRFIALALAPGVTWRRALAAPSGAPTVASVREVAGSLLEVRRSGALARHGDIKPENLVLAPSGTTTILDPSSGMDADAPLRRRLCTRLYAPTLLDDDVPALGLVLIEVLTGVHPLLAPERGERALGEELRRTRDAVRATGGARWFERTLRMPLPSELRADVGECLEATALGCLGLAWDGRRLEGRLVLGLQELVDRLPAPR